MRKRWLALAVGLCLAAGIGLAVQRGWPGLAMAMVVPGPPPAIRADPQQCLADLAATGLAYSPICAFQEQGGCGVSGGVRLAGGPVALNQDFIASCPLARAFAEFEAQVLQPQALHHFGQGIARLDHVGSYNCRQMRRTVFGTLSQHAYANALDVAGFVLEDGRRIGVAQAWGEPGPDGAFLADMARHACGVFRVVLTPDYDRWHAGHMHFDMGPSRRCR